MKCKERPGRVHWGAADRCRWRGASGAVEEFRPSESNYFFLIWKQRNEILRYMLLGKPGKIGLKGASTPFEDLWWNIKEMKSVWLIRLWSSIRWVSISGSTGASRIACHKKYRNGSLEIPGSLEPWKLEAFLRIKPGQIYLDINYAVLAPLDPFLAYPLN